MNIYRSLDQQKLINLLKEGSVGLLPTDTIYGISCTVDNIEAVEKVYMIKGRKKEIPVIVLISDLSDLEKFDLDIDNFIKKILLNNWPGKISFILPLKNKFEYLTRGSKGLSFRMPENDELLRLLQKTGPLISTSANPSGNKPAENLKEAIDYFGNKLDFYVDFGEIIGSASTLVDLTEIKPTVLRQGEKVFKIST